MFYIRYKCPRYDEQYWCSEANLGGGTEFRHGQNYYNTVQSIKILNQHMGGLQPIAYATNVCSAKPVRLRSLARALAGMAVYEGTI